MPNLEELTAFCERVRPADTVITNRLNASFSRWRRYYVFLHVIHSRYDELDRVFLDAMHRQKQAVNRAIEQKVGPRAVTTEELQESLRIAGISDRLHLEIESFYIFSKILVDRMADTFAFFFGFTWRWRGSTHGKLAKEFDSRCKCLGFGEAPELQKLMAEVQKRIVQYRTDDIEHVSEPGLMHATMFHMTEGKALIAPSVVCPADAEAAGQKYAEKRAEIPGELCPLIDSYAAALLGFFEANMDKSIAAVPKPTSIE